MFELSVDTHERLLPAHAIAVEVDSWLRGEIRSSSIGNDAVWDDYNLLQDSLPRDYRDGSNANARKVDGHILRLRLWTEKFAVMPQPHDDYNTARQIFCAQMNLSGLFRLQCFVQATDQDSYLARRLQPIQPLNTASPLGINIFNTVQSRLEQHFGRLPAPRDFQETAVSLQDLVALTNAINEAYLQQTKTLYKGSRHDWGKEESRTVAHLKEAQQAWLNLIVDYVVFAADERDGQLNRVPFLEPKSISEHPKVYYPFAA